MIPPRKKRNSSKVNLVISVVFHSIIIVALFYFAAREGLLGKQLKKIAITMAPKEKPAEKPKEPEHKAEPPKVEEPPKVAEAPKVAAAAAAPPVTVVAAPTVAPPAMALPSFDFGGGKVVESSSDPQAIYKGQVEYALRLRWNRPEDAADENYVAEVEVAIDPTGTIAGSEWKRRSGDARWDESVRKAIAGTATVGRAPPKGFPPRFLVRFDVQNQTEPLLQ